MQIYECKCDCHSSNGLMKHCTPCCITCRGCGRNIKFEFEKEHEKECKPLAVVVDEDTLNPTEQDVIDNARDLMEKVLARIETSTKQYGTNYVLANVMRETEDELLDIIGWPLLEVIRMRQLFLKKLGQLDGKYLDKFLAFQTFEYLSYLKEKIDAELVKRQ